jgi:hypothetical protein
MTNDNSESRKNQDTQTINLWERFKEVLDVIRPTWLTTVIVLGISFAIQHQQAVDALNAIAAKGVFSGRNLGLLITLLIFSASGWYFPRALLYVKYQITPKNSEKRFEPLRRWFPRILGTFPILSVAIIFARSKDFVFMLLYLIIAALFFVFLYFRRTKIFLGYEPVVFLHKELPGKTFKAVGLLLILAVSLFLTFILSPVNAPQFFGPIGIVFLAASCWFAFGSMLLIYPTYHYRLPSLVVVLFLLAVIFGFWNDNHRVRTIGDNTLDWNRATVAEHFEKWLDFRQPAIAASPHPYAVFIVAAEGGGIRAAYWTAAVLGVLQQHNPDFACHVFALSGVSGGSLGASAFAAQVADDIEAGLLDCTKPFHNKSDSINSEYLQFLGQDFLSPTLAGMLFPDLLQRFSPTWGKFVLPDRAKYLERAWEEEWRNQTKSGSDRFAESFSDLWKSEVLLYQVPSLFLNGTWVEGGVRNVTSNLLPSSVHFVQLDDMITRVDRPISLATAAHMSARFTYVSPAGSVCYNDVTYHVVDGGYFENSGALTATEIIDVIADVCKADSRCNNGQIRLVALIISNDSDSPNAFRDLDHERFILTGKQCQEKEAPTSQTKKISLGKSSQLLNETLSPVKTLFGTRKARGYHSEDLLRSKLTPCNTIRFQLKQVDKIKIPLGWMLSDETQSEMRKQAETNPAVEVISKMLKDVGS